MTDPEAATTLRASQRSVSHTTEPSSSEHPSIVGRIKLGWLLGMTTALVVGLLMAGLLLSQQRLILGRVQADREGLLDELLAPLVSDLEGATTIEEIRSRIYEYQMACLERGHPGLHFELVGSDGDMVVSTAAAWRTVAGYSPARDELPVRSPLFTGGTARLTVWQDDAAYTALIEAHRRYLALDLIMLVASVLVSLLVLNHFLVTRPLRRLVEGVRRMENGLLFKPANEGAWEWRWLSSRIAGLRKELDEKVRCLLDAERKAMGNRGNHGDGQAPGDPGAIGDPSSPHGGDAIEAGRIPDVPEATSNLFSTALTMSEPRKRSIEEDLLVQSWLDKCKLLEAANPRNALAREMALEVWEKDVLHAARSNRMLIRSRLDDAAFRILFPEEYQLVTDRVVKLNREKSAWAIQQVSAIKRTLRAQEIPVLAVQRRVKHPAGVYRKMRSKGLQLDDVKDIIGYRIIVPEVQHCYRALKAVHERYTADPLCFTDYIVSPKPNGYQSLHTTLRSDDGTIFEVQIRTARMHLEASTNHWSYKEEQGRQQTRTRRHFPRLRGLRKREEATRLVPDTHHWLATPGPPVHHL